MRPFVLTDRAGDFYTWHGVTLELNLAFDNVLLLLDLFEEDIPELVKLDIALEMLVIDTAPLDQLEGEQAMDLILDLLRDELGIDLRKERNEEAEPSIPTHDFKEDAERIYASFLFDYQVDLFEQQGRLHWRKFLALFNNLSEKSPMGIAWHYRTCEVPPADKHNKKERAHVLKMKKKYQLRSVLKAEEEKKLREIEASFARMKSQQRKG